MNDFKPHWFFRNPHLQTILASTGPRTLLVRQRAKQLISDAVTHTLDCGDGIQLQGEYSEKTSNNNGLVIMIHGWLGDNESLYLLSAGSRLYNAGYNIFRLNLRDHGDTLHLNKGLFNSTRIDEAVNACREIQRRFVQQRNYLCGFSLGGNFALRIAASTARNQLDFSQVVAICPVINPHKANRNLHDGLFIYHDSFKKSWQRSLLKKHRYFPELNYAEQLKGLKTLDDMNHYFVPNHTDYNTVNDYLDGYAIDDDQLDKLTVPCHIISSQDDPILPAEDLQKLVDKQNLTIELTRHGGHCGYLENFSMNSWIDRRLLDIFSGA